MTSAQLAVGLLFLAIGVLACLAPAQGDTWWLLRAGADIWRTHAVPLTDQYSFTAAGRFWPNHEWLTEATFYAMYRLGGMPGVTTLCAAALVGAWAISWRLGRGAFEVQFVLFAIAMPPIATAFALRPQALTLAAFALTCLLLVSNRPGWLPALVLVWTNLHGAVVLGLVAIAAAICAEALTTRRPPVRLLVTGAACAAATLVSPLGWRLWSFIPASTARSQIDQLIEWLPPDLSPHLWPFWAIAAGLPIVALVRRKRLEARTTTLLIIALALLPLAVRSLRNVAVFLVAALPALSTMLMPAPSRMRGASQARDRNPVNAAILALGAAIGIAIVAIAWRGPAPNLGWRPISSGAVTAVASCGEPQYNTYGQGGTLIWFVPHKRVFTDNRQDPYPIDLLRAAHRVELDGDYQGLFQQYGIRCAVTPPSSPVAERLRADPAWVQRFADAHWAIFTKQ